MKFILRYVSSSYTVWVRSVNPRYRDPQVEKELSEKIGHFWTWMLDSRPENLTRVVNFCIETEYQVLKIADSIIQPILIRHHEVRLTKLSGNES